VSENAGKKAVRWDLDVDILTRLDIVANMMVQGARPHQIAQSLSYSLKTAYRDVDRVRTLWRRTAEATVEEHRSASIAQYNELKVRAWEEYRRLREEKKSGLNALRVVMDIEEKISELQGTKAPKNVDVTSKGEQIGRSAKEYTDDELADILARSR